MRFKRPTKLVKRFIEGKETALHNYTTVHSDKGHTLAKIIRIKCSSMRTVNPFT